MAIDYTQLISTAIQGGVQIYGDRKNRQNERKMRIDELNMSLKMQSGDMYYDQAAARNPGTYAARTAVASTAAIGSCAAQADFSPEAIDAGWSIFIWGVIFTVVVFSALGWRKSKK